MPRPEHNLATSFFENTTCDPSRLALWVDGTGYSYGEMASYAAATANSLGSAARVGILGSRSLTAYAGVLGAAWCGAVYVPMNPNLPDDRLARIFETVGFDGLVADDKGVEALTPRLTAMVKGPVLTRSTVTRVSPAAALPRPRSRQASDAAYVIFTSGSTGDPKGVTISTGSVAFFLRAIQNRFGFQAGDRFSQASELTFDVSVNRRASAPPGRLSQSERDWAYAKRALARGEPEHLIVTAIALHRRFDKYSPQTYAELTVRKAAESLKVDHGEAPER